jgi:hypothetical protein
MSTYVDKKTQRFLESQKGRAEYGLSEHQIQASFDKGKSSQKKIGYLRLHSTLTSESGLEPGSPKVSQECPKV